MRAEARLDSAVFQLTPTRTRCDLVIIANGKTEKIASGLLNPFLAHLKTAQSQISKGGYSITLEPDPTIDASWFTKGTVERFVRFVSTPEVLERVSTIESEILQIEEAISIQGNETMGLTSVEDHQTRSTELTEGTKHVLDADAEKAIVLYKPGSALTESNGSTPLEENSKIQLLRVLETRKIVLQKEQGMAFARAAAAGFDMDHMSHLILFAECFGASRLKEACLQFMELWKGKHESGQWLEVEAAEAMSSRSEFYAMNTSGIILSGDAMGTESNGKAGSHIGGDHSISDPNGDKRIPSDLQVPLAPHEYFQGHFQQPTFPQWPMHSLPGAPTFQPYPMQGMPYYQNYPANGPFFQSPYPPMEDPRFNAPQRMGMKRHSMDSHSNIGSETWERSHDDGADGNMSVSDRDASHGRKPHKRGGRSGKKKSGGRKSKRHQSSESESQSTSNSETEEETDSSDSDVKGHKHKKSSKSSKKKDHQEKSVETSKSYGGDEVIYGQEADSGNWHAFQSFLLKAEEKKASIVDGDTFSNEKEPPVKRKNTIEADPMLTPERDSGNIQDTRTVEFDAISGKSSRIMRVASPDDLLTEGRVLGDSQVDAHFREIEGGGGGYRRTTSDDFMIHGRDNHIGNKISGDPLVEPEYEHPRNLEKSSYTVTDESFVVPFRTGSQDQLETNSRTAIDMDSELPFALQRKEDESSTKAVNQIRYEPDDLTLMHERETESEYIGYDPAIDYDFQIPVAVAVKQETSNQEDISTDTKEELKNPDKEKKPKVLNNGLEKRRKDAMLRKGASSKSNPLAEAQKRAEKLRAFKADLQKAKKDNEEEQRKRLEALKIERQRRIAARSSSNPAQSPLTTKQTRASLPTKLSSSSYKGSKFSDSEPGSNSPLQKLSIRSTSIGSNDSQKVVKTSRLNSTGHELSRSVSSLPELKKESNGSMHEAKAGSNQIRRLSDPKSSNTQRISQKTVGGDHIPKRNEPQTKKISAIMQLDKTKSATLPELKIKASGGSPDTLHNKSVTKKTLQKEAEGTSPTFESIEANKTGEKSPRISNSDDNPVIEKNVVMLENERTTGPVVQSSEGMIDRSYGDDRKERIDPPSAYAAVHAPPSPVLKVQIEDSYEVVDFSNDESQNFTNYGGPEKSYQAPYARSTSLEDLSASKFESTDVSPALNSEFAISQNESIKEHVSSFSDSGSVDQIHDSYEKPRNKESKGFRKLLKFGRKSHGSVLGEGNMDSDGSSIDDHTVAAASSNDIHTLKNLISQDETHACGTPPKVSRPFSILSPFRSSKTNEKKLAV